MSRRLKRWACAAFLLALTTPLAVAQEQEKVGERPYEHVPHVLVRHHASSEADRRSRRRRFLLLLDLRKQLDVGQPSGDAARQRLCAPARFEGERV